MTAERRATDLQKTPVAVEAVSQDTLLRAGVATLTSLQKVMPDVQFIMQSGGGTDQVMVRGVQSTDASPTSETAVATYINGAVLAKQPGMEGFLFDIQRVEVDKGPQGTLFGRNTNGGAVNIITNPAVLARMQGDVQLEGGSYDTQRFSGYVNIPLGDSFALRGAFLKFYHQGYNKSGLYDANTNSGRLSALWDVSSREKINIVVDASTDNAYDDAPVQNIIGVMPGNPKGIYVPPNPRDDTFYTEYYGGHATGANSPYKANTQVGGQTIEDDYSFDAATWTTIFAHRYMSRDQVGPNNYGQGPVVLAPNGTMAPTSGHNYVPQAFRSYSLESRLASTATVPFQWVAGIYLFQEHDTGTMIGYGSEIATVPSIEIANPYETDRTGAVFAQVTYTPSGLSQLHLTAGGRGEVDTKVIRNIYTRFGTTPYPYNALVAYKSHHWGAGTYRAEVSYDVTPSSLLYVDTATGFKAGGYGYGPGINPADGPVYGPERITAYEIGSKNRFINNRLQVNFEAWTYHYTGFTTGFAEFGCAVPPAGSPVVGSTCGGLPVLTTATAGQANYRGGTIDIQWLINPSNQFNINFSRLYARYGTYIQTAAPDYSLAPGAYVPTLSTLTNSQIPQVPHSTGNASYVHTWNDVLGGSFNFELDGQYRGPEMLALTVDPLYGRIELWDHAWVMGDVSLQYQHAGGNWSLTAYAHNFTNGLHPVVGSESSAIHAISEGFLPPRVIGMILQARF